MRSWLKYIAAFAACPGAAFAASTVGYSTVHRGQLVAGHKTTSLGEGIVLVLLTAFIAGRALTGRYANG